MQYFISAEVLVKGTNDEGRIVEVVGVGRAIRSMTMTSKAGNVRTITPGTLVGYTLREYTDKGYVDLVMDSEFGLQVYTKTDKVAASFEGALKFFGLDETVPDQIRQMD